jgi:hypothetical protein
MLFEKELDRQKEGVLHMTLSINLSPYMPLRRFEDIKKYFPMAFADIDKINHLDPSHDSWHMISRLVDDFNNNRRKMVAASIIKLLDESMSAWNPRKNKTGGLPSILFIKRQVLVTLLPLLSISDNNNNTITSKKKGNVTVLIREMPETPIPEKVLSKKVRCLPSPPTSRMLRRKGTPTCSHVGLNSHLLYPDYFFCHSCTEWDTQLMLGIKGRKCRPARLPCMANHASISFPSDKLVVADSRCYCGTPRRSQRPPREKAQKMRVIIPQMINQI